MSFYLIRDTLARKHSSYQSCSAYSAWMPTYLKHDHTRESLASNLVENYKQLRYTLFQVVDTVTHKMPVPVGSCLLHCAEVMLVVCVKTGSIPIIVGAA